MATTSETMYVSDETQLQATARTLIARGGVVEGEGPGVMYIALKKRRITVRVGLPSTVRTDKQHWYDHEAVDGLAPGTVPSAPAYREETGPWPPAGAEPAPAGGRFGAPPPPPPGSPGGPAQPVPETTVDSLPPPPSPPAPVRPTDPTVQMDTPPKPE